MSWRSWPEPGFVGYKPLDEDGLLGVKPCLGGCRIGELWEVICIGILPLFLGSREIPSCPSRQDKSLGLEAEGRDPDLGDFVSLTVEFWSRTSARSLGHQTPLSIVLGCTCGRSKSIHSLIGDISPGEWAIILDSIQTCGLDRIVYSSIDLQTCFNGHVFGLNEDSHVDKWIIRKNHHVGPSKCSKGGHHCHTGMRRCPYGGDWSELAESLMEIPGTQDFSLHFWRLYGSMNRVEECMRQDPRILRGRILARLRIKGMRRPGGRNRGSSCLIRLALLAPLELVKAVMDFHSGLHAGGTFSMFVLVLGDNLVDSWYRSKILGHVVCDGLVSCFPGGSWACFPESEDLEIHPSETHGSWVQFFINRRLYGLSSRNLETGWTFVLEPGGWMDSRPGTQRL
ncbi:hypothetical protein HID58_048351 [Brassica napus]|uniref:Uncharacterized protein n=1 Tax=Brassica napus TaxID=3708 RepID=A0ABQ8B266_BRANA|nr:hypothetical protein HID58_048351 [Brassica napus]